MQKTVLWVAAFIVTISMAVYQRMTGPTYPLKGALNTGGAEITYRFDRTCDDPGDQEVTIHVTGAREVSGRILWRRANTGEGWSAAPMSRIQDNLTGFLPHQPPAGKLNYYVELRLDGQTVKLPAQPVTTRFKGAVPVYWLYPHVICMFTALLLAVRIGLAMIFREPVAKMVGVSFWFMLIGGLILGPIVQQYAFGAFWTGIPFGWDLTDNKTLFAFIAWAAAYALTRREGRGILATILAVVITLAVYLIPHSVWGTQYDYSRGRITAGPSGP